MNATAAQRNRRLRLERKAEGLCPACGGYRVNPLWVLCQRCRIRLAAWMRALKARRKSAGRCPDCGKVKPCECWRKRYEARKAKGCPSCGHCNPRRRMRYCARCRRLSAQRSRLSRQRKREGVAA